MKNESRRGGDCRNHAHGRGSSALRSASVAAAALLSLFGAGLATRVAEARPAPDGPAVVPGKKPYQASICTNGKVYPGIPRNRPGCTHGFTTVSGWVKYDGAHARLAGSIHCTPTSRGPTNKETWCGVVNNGASPPEMYMSLGANGKFESRKQISTTIGGGAEGNLPSKKKSKNDTKVNIQGSRTETREAVHIKRYWIRIDVRPDGTYNLRGGAVG
jgi:hypothetical protein